LQQLAEFNKDEWDLNIFRPFCILNEHCQFGIALRFLRFFPYIPKNIKITEKALSILSLLNIGKSMGEISAFVWRDLMLPSPFDEPTDALTVKFLNKCEENRTKAISKIFQHYPK